MVHVTRILVDDISGTGPFMSVQLPNMFLHMIPADFKGVTLDDLVVLEQLLSLNMYVYDLQETEAGDIAARLVQRSP
jgi:hypothetical protein